MSDEQIEHAQAPWIAVGREIHLASRPWPICEMSKRSSAVLGKHGYDDAIAEDYANAAHIVKCVNERDALVKFAESMILELEDIAGLLEINPVEKVARSVAIKLKLAKEDLAKAQS